MTDQPQTIIEPYAAAIRKLLKGVVYHDDAVWAQIRDYELPIREYFQRIGLSLHLDQIGNFAYLQDESRDDDGKDTLPPITSRRALSFLDTLLLVLLRERLDEHEMRDLDGSPLILSTTAIHEMVMVFLVDTTNAQKVDKNMQNSINRLEKYGFLTKYRDDIYTVRPLLRAKISADELSEVKARLKDYLGIEEEVEDEESL
jgi:hypothetical protein